MTVEVLGRSPKPYRVDELQRKHEGSPYDDADSEIRSIEHGGQSLRLIVRKYTPPFRVLTTALAQDLLFLLCEQLDKEGEDGRVIEGGNGILMVARMHPRLENTYWLAVCHVVFTQAMRGLIGDEWTYYRSK